MSTPVKSSGLEVFILWAAGIAITWVAIIAAIGLMTRANHFIATAIGLPL